MAFDIEVRKYSLKYQPPTLIIEYHDHASDRTFRRRIRFRPLSPSSRKRTTPERIADKIIEKNLDILSYKTVSKEQLVDMVQLLLFSDDDFETSVDGGHQVDDGTAAVEHETSTMALGQDRNHIALAAISSSSSNRSLSLTTHQEDNQSDNDFEGLLTSPKLEMHMQTHEHYEDKFGDLNKVTDEENKRAKELMGVDFERNRIRPNDSEFVYDKQVDFGPAEEENEWDDDSDAD